MPFIFKRLLLFASIAAVFAADKEQPAFRAPVAAAMPHRQTNEEVTVAAEPYASGDKIKAAFGKLDPYEYGILPVLVVIENSGKAAIRMDRLKVEYVGSGRERVEATPARDIRYLQGPDRPKMITGPGGKPKILKPKKNPLDAWEIEGRAFAAKMLPPGQSASGFFYFQSTFRPGATFYLSGLTEASKGRELFYFEIPLE
jgi:hypothetical protein